MTPEVMRGVATARSTALSTAAVTAAGKSVVVVEPAVVRMATARVAAASMAVTYG